MPKPLKNIKHENFVQQLYQGMNPTDAYKSQYPGVSTSTACKNANRLSKREDVQVRMVDIFNSINLKDEDLANKLKELSNAQDSLSFKGELTGDIKPDYRIQLDALKLILELKNHIKTGNDTNIQVNQQFNEMPPEFLEHLRVLDANLKAVRDEIASSNGRPSGFEVRD